MESRKRAATYCWSQLTRIMIVNWQRKSLLGTVLDIWLLYTSKGSDIIGSTEAGGQHDRAKKSTVFKDEAKHNMPLVRSEN